MKNMMERNLESEWFAIKTHQEFKVENLMLSLCDDVFFPKISSYSTNKKPKMKALIPHVLFIKTTRDNALLIESRSQKYPELMPKIWIYRYPNNKMIQAIPYNSINLLRLLTTNNSTECEIFNKQDFKENERVRITGGPYAGYEGFVQRVKKNKHVIVKIEGVCLVMLPYIHPDLLEKLNQEE